MTDIWPSDLPQCLPLDGQQEAMADNLLRSQPDAGPAQVRRRSSAGVRPFAAMMMLSRQQLETLKTFVDATLLGGALPFSLPAQTEDGVWLVRFAPGGLPKWTRVGGKFNVKIQLEILP
jgi:hypothetical protein